MAKKQPKETSFYMKIIETAWKDPAFKKQLLKNPKEALKSLGADLPKDLKVRVIEDKVGELTIVLPPSPAESGEDQIFINISAAGECVDTLRICKHHHCHHG